MIFQILASLLILTFYIIYFLKLFSLKKKGIQVNNLGKKEKKTKKIIKIEITLKIFTILMFLVEVFSIIIDDNWYYIYESPVLKIIGLILILLGDVIFFLSVYYMKTSWRVGIDETRNDKLITNGIYRISRNPAFLGFDLTYLGLALVFPNPIMIIFTIILIWLFDDQIMIEEEYLERKYKEEYLEYKKKTKRYFLFF
ncbi:MAG: isoprenylcysteine carboxylmethyltransferase family protein [Bacilli bacterium]|nr:isoprenylcysteine carboxylmethyltransferase family protein [Acholeplasmataceae bacterium]MDY2902062.1 isoprenylcysteine carboxylmethyltransferase family protein [Bacilli bacterium]